MVRWVLLFIVVLFSMVMTWDSLEEDSICAKAGGVSMKGRYSFYYICYEKASLVEIRHY